MFLFFFDCSQLIVHNTFAATEVNGQHVNGAESELQNAMDRAAIDIVQGMISFIFFVEQLQMPIEFLISNRLFIAFVKL